MNPTIDSSGGPTRRSWLKAMSVVTAGGLWGARPFLRAAAAKLAPTLSASQRGALRAVVEDAIARRVVPGAALVVLARGEVVFREGFGRTEFDGARPFGAELPCFIASLTKGITATFMVMLDERGALSLDDPVEKYLPEFRGVRLKGGGPVKATLRVWQLLSHRSGLPGNADPEDLRPQDLLEPAAGAVAPEFPLAEAVTRYVKRGLLAEPGARFAYGHAGYMVAARIAEVVLGRRFEVLLTENLLTPLAMSHTTFFPTAETLALAPARYQSTRSGPTRDTRMPLPRAGGLVNPAGGLCSTLDDMAAFVRLHLNRGRVGDKQLIAASSLQRMYRPHPPRAKETADGGGNGYGLGLNVIAPGGIVRHLGATGTLDWVDLKHQHAGVLLTQVKWGAGNRPLIPRLMKEVQAIFA